VLPPRRPLLHPLPQRLDLRGRELPNVFRRRHHLFWIGRRDTSNELAFRRLARHDDGHAVFDAKRAGLRIEAQVALAGLLIGPVTVVALGGKDRQDVAGVVDRSLRRRRARGER
jgi:hypothetical protein